MGADQDETIKVAAFQGTVQDEITLVNSYTNQMAKALARACSAEDVAQAAFAYRNVVFEGEPGGYTSPQQSARNRKALASAERRLDKALRQWEKDRS
jgi:hypothetical protein